MKHPTLALIVSVFVSFSVLWLSPVVWGSTAQPIILIAQAGLTAEQAAATVQARTGGRILAVKRKCSDGRVVYRIKVLTPKGEVRIFYVDAATGEM